ncbi:MAG: (2Fe-2S)-binding protein [Phycisphaerales bacterium]|nr:(2Fe-2S)-binding protein [Phycisphaerales bacterium]
MHPDDHVCLCFRVSQRKLVHYIRRECPTVASQLSDCLGAGTGCGWCVPFLRKLHAQWEAGDDIGLDIAPQVYADRRKKYRATGERDDVEAEGRSPGSEPGQSSDPPECS